MTVSGEKRRRIEDEGDATKAKESGTDSSEPIVIDDLNRDFQTGDIRLIAADGVVFMCESYKIRAASAAFADMLASEPQRQRSNEIRFVDKNIETGKIIYIFLKACRGEMGDALVEYDNDEAVFGYTRFISKWDCLGQIETITDKMEPGPWDGEDNNEDDDEDTCCSWEDHFAFGVGAILEDIGLCYRAIRYSPHRVNKFVDDPSLDKCHEGALMLDLHGCSPQFIDALPHKYFRALLRAQLGVNMAKHDEVDWKAMAKEFRRLMRQ